LTIHLGNRPASTPANTGSLFQTLPSGPPGSAAKGIVSSEYHRGAVHLPSGRYGLYVNAVAPDEPMGSWTIVIR